MAATRKLGVAPLAAKGIIKTFGVFDIVQISPTLIQDAIDCSILNELSFGTPSSWPAPRRRDARPCSAKTSMPDRSSSASR